MKNWNWEESNMCKFDHCVYYDWEENKCIRNICIILEKNDNRR